MADAGVAHCRVSMRVHTNPGPMLGASAFPRSAMQIKEVFPDFKLAQLVFDFFAKGSTQVCAAIGEQKRCVHQVAVRAGSVLAHNKPACVHAQNHYDCLQTHATTNLCLDSAT